MVIGRAKTADICLSDPTVSLFHVELTSSVRGIVIRDVGSTNGTRIGDVLVETVVAPTSCTLTLGATTLRVELGEDRTASPERGRDRRTFGGLVGESAPMRALYSFLERLAPTDLSLLITGATGSGKELAARAIHAASRRASGPFIVLDCAALPEQLAPSVLFGHEKGAFTGAVGRREGAFEAAHGGTLFLDEIGELPAPLQPMLLRVLERREVVAIGKTEARPVDVRVVGATWRDLRAMVNDGTFREDLYYRLARTTVRMPSLAERPEDIPLLIHHFLQTLPKEVQAARTITKDALDLLAAGNYPGNARELHNVVERVAVLARGPLITAADLAFDRLLSTARREGGLEDAHGAAVPLDRDAPAPADGREIEPFKDAKRSLIDEFERTYLAHLLAKADHNLSRAAVMAGLQRHNLRDLLRKHGLHG
jgi:DNA-binding NtrC family response regulator